MAEEYSPAFDIGSLLHNLLFSLQKAQTELLGDGHEVFYHPTIDLLLKIEEKAKLKLVSAETLDEALTNFSTFLVKTQAMKNFTIKKDNEGKYTVTNEGCVWAPNVHSELKPKDVICPWAMIAMAIVQKFKNVRLEETKSTYSPDGSQTVIQPLHFGFSKSEALKLCSTVTKIS